MRNRRVLCRRFPLRNRYRLEIFKNRKIIGDFKTFLYFCIRETIFYHTSLFALCLVGYGTEQYAGSSLFYEGRVTSRHRILFSEVGRQFPVVWNLVRLIPFRRFPFANYSDAYISSSDQPPRKVEWLAEDALGNLWIKTLDWKLSVFFKQTERFEDVYEELKPYARNLQVIKIQADGTGKILLLTKDKNLLLAETLRMETSVSRRW